MQLRIGALQELLRQKGVQQVTILSEPSAATVVVDRRPMGVTPWTGDLTPGAHHLELRLRGYADAEHEFELPAARAVDVRVALVQDAPSAAPVSPRPTPSQPVPDVTPPERSLSRKTWGFVALGAAGAAFGGALTFELLRRSAEQDARDEPEQIAFRDAVDRMESRRTAARIFAGAGAALAVTGGVLVAIDMLRDWRVQQSLSAAGQRLCDVRRRAVRHRLQPGLQAVRRPLRQSGLRSPALRHVHHGVRPVTDLLGRHVPRQLHGRHHQLQRVLRQSHER